MNLAGLQILTGSDNERRRVLICLRHMGIYWHGSRGYSTSDVERRWPQAKYSVLSISAGGDSVQGRAITEEQAFARYPNVATATEFLEVFRNEFFPPRKKESGW